MILTSNLTLGSWDQAFAGETVLTAAMLDRLHARPRRNLTHQRFHGFPGVLGEAEVAGVIQMPLRHDLQPLLAEYAERGRLHSIEGGRHQPDPAGTERAPASDRPAAPTGRPEDCAAAGNVSRSSSFRRAPHDRARPTSWT